MTEDVGSMNPTWDLVRLAEANPQALQARVDTELERGRRDYQPLSADAPIGERVRRAQESPRNRARFERFSDYVVPGDSVVEVGCGWGFVGARLLAAGAGTYRGMDLLAQVARRTGEVLEAIGHGDRTGPMAHKDLYEISPPDLAGATLVVCSEVIEHVPDPEKALEVLGRALPEDGELLFSVPLLNRLEKVWGHLGIFTADRLVAMLERAGLVANHVEPLADQWVLVLAGRADASPSRRAERLERITAGTAQYAAVDMPETIPTVAPQPTRFDNVPIDSVELVPLRRTVRDITRRVSTTTAAADDSGSITAEVGARTLLRWPATGGVGLSLAGVDPVRGVRLQYSVDHPADVVRLDVLFRGPGDDVAARWRWTFGDRAKSGTIDKLTVVVRPGQDGGAFRGPAEADLSGAERVEVLATVAAGRTVRLTISRVAWIR